MTSSLPTSIPGLRKFADDEARVADVFDTAFLPNTDGVKKLEKWLEEDFEVEVVAKMAQSFSPDRKVHLLGVGTGDGMWHNAHDKTWRKYCSIWEFKGEMRTGLI